MRMMISIFVSSQKSEFVIETRTWLVITDGTRWTSHLHNLPTLVGFCNNQTAQLKKVKLEGIKNHGYTKQNGYIKDFGVFCGISLLPPKFYQLYTA